MGDLDYLIDILESSVEKHGEKPLTNKWLLNIVKMAEKSARREEDYDDFGWKEF